jgi:hypothetical protein
MRSSMLWRSISTPLSCSITARHWAPASRSDLVPEGVELREATAGERDRALQRVDGRAVG